MELTPTSAKNGILNQLFFYFSHTYAGMNSSTNIYTQIVEVTCSNVHMHLQQRQKPSNRVFFSSRFSIVRFTEKLRRPSFRKCHKFFGLLKVENDFVLDFLVTSSSFNATPSL